MSFKTEVPFKLLKIDVQGNLDPNDHVKLRIRIIYQDTLKNWFNENLGELPEISVSRQDFEDSIYFISLPTSELQTQFKMAWY